MWGWERGDEGGKRGKGGEGTYKGDFDDGMRLEPCAVPDVLRPADVELGEVCTHDSLNT